MIQLMILVQVQLQKQTASSVQKEGNDPKAFPPTQPQAAVSQCPQTASPGLITGSFF